MRQWGVISIGWGGPSSTSFSLGGPRLYPRVIACYAERYVVQFARIVRHACSHVGTILRVSKRVPSMNRNVWDLNKIGRVENTHVHR